MAAIRVSYHHVRAWYFARRRELGEPSDMVVALRPFRAMRFNNETARIEPFRYHRTHAFRLRGDDPLVASHPAFFPLGGYISFVGESEAAAEHDTAMFVVAPRLVRHPLGPTLLLADHLSYVVQGTGTRLNLHRTKYVPKDDDVNYGNHARDFNPLPLEFTMPGSPERFRDDRTLVAGLAAAAEGGALGSHRVRLRPDARPARRDGARPVRRGARCRRTQPGAPSAGRREAPRRAELGRVRAVAQRGA